MRADKKPHLKSDKKTAARSHKRGVVGYSKKTALLEEAITQMNAGKYGRSSAALKELLALDPLNMEARRLFATLHLRLGSLIPARQAFDSLINEALERQDYWLAESLLREYLAAGPRCVPFLEKLGTLFEEKGDALEAAVEYGKAIDILIEDPDTDNPQHAAQLYTKIRELAPASSVAFRLASCFDAQTGELIARPSAAYSSDTTIANEIADPISDPSTASAPLDQVEADSTLSLPPISPEPITEPTLHPAVAADALQESGHQTEHTPPAGFLDPVDTFHLDVLTSSPPPDVNAGPDCQALDVEPMAAASIPPAVTTTASPMAAEAVTVEPPEFELASPPAADLMPVICPQDQDPFLTHTRESGAPESISAPMPWEDVQDSTITIPDHVADDLPQPSAQAEEIPASTSDDHAPPAESREEPIVIPPLSVDAAQSPSIPPIHESTTAVPASSSADLLSMPPPPETSKRGFSWDSVFDSAWRFGDKFLSSPSVQQVETKAEPEAASQAAPIAPMPWDQVQESTVTIPPAVVEAIADAVPEPTPAPFPILEDAAIAPAEPVISPTPSAMEEQAFSITHPPAPSLSPAPEFRLLGRDAGQSDDTAHSAGKESQLSSPAEPSAQVDQHQAESPVVVLEAVNSIPSVDSGLHYGLQEEVAAPAPSIIADPVPDLAQGVPLEAVSLQAEPLSGREDRIEEAALQAEAAIQPTAISPALSTGGPVPGGEDALQQPLDEEPLQPPDEGHHQVVSVEPVTEHLQSHSAVAMSAPPPESTETGAAIPVPSTAQPVMEAPSLPPDHSSHWSTGEVAVQTHRPTPKKRKRGIAPTTEPTPVPLPVEAEAQRPSHEEPQVYSEETGSGGSVSLPVQEPDEWIRTSESIRFIEPRVPQSTEAGPPITRQEETRPTVSSAAAAVDVLFESSGRIRRTETREREPVAEPRRRPRLRVKLARMRIAMSLFVSSCFSTTRAMVISVAALFLLSGALTALAVGAVGLVWTIMEERPSSAFQSLTTVPERTLSDPKKNGYVLILGFDALGGQDPFQAGYERKPDGNDAGLSGACTGGSSGDSRGGQTNASARVASGWFRGSDPIAQFKAHQDTIRGWTAQAEAALGRYSQWLKLPFEDWGYGQSVTPPCGAILFAHQLYLADGFVQGMDTAIDRLETDMEAWRMVLGKAKTLPVKTMALEAINNDIAVASELLITPDFDGKLLGRLTKMLRPLDQVELSIRWPMQSELVAASKTFAARMKADRKEELPLHVVVASALPLPKQRRFNDYADYYEASYKAAGEGRHASLPKWAQYIRFPANTFADYVMNPIENIVGLEPLPEWDRYNGMVVDTDAHLRLASLQAWLRRGPPDADLLARIAKAGQSVYDPYTGLPMLVNLKKGVMYSVGHDGKDQDADPKTDIVVTIPLSQFFGISPRSTSSKFK